ncbi:hypothetical protein [Cylindrospermopsis raciborskii]|nr:hypothetical protein [Cylindrospermopsis raciborskii]
MILWKDLYVRDFSKLGMVFSHQVHETHSHSRLQRRQTRMPTWTFIH